MNLLSGSELCVCIVKISNMYIVTYTCINIASDLNLIIVGYVTLRDESCSTSYFQKLHYSKYIYLSTYISIDTRYSIFNLSIARPAHIKHPYDPPHNKPTYNHGITCSHRS